MNVSAGREAPTMLRDAIGVLHHPVSEAPRIVSLVPSLTELLCDLDLIDSLVGRTGFCIHPRDALKAVPKVGGTKDVRLDALRALEPSHLIVNIDENRRETVDEIARFVPNVIVTHPCRPEDNHELFRLFGGVFHRERQAEALSTELAAALFGARQVADSLPVERVLYLIWREPWMSVARDTYISATLATVGWESLPTVADTRYPEIDWRAPWMVDAARVFLSTEPYRFQERHLDEFTVLSGRPASLIDGEMTSWYGSRAAAGLRYLAQLRVQLAGAVQRGAASS
jgi:ABC-type Fe3+-hydroxamate transport system substrate-binding protein